MSFAWDTLGIQRIHSPSGLLRRSLATRTHFPISRPNAAFFEVQPNQFGLTRRSPFSHSEKFRRPTVKWTGRVSQTGGRITSTMSDLAAKTCVPCRGGVSPLKGEELAALETQVDGWNVIEEHHITKTFKCLDFREALKFANHVGELAEEQGHHPDISLAWGKVEITTWTHKINGLTESDFILAAKIDQLYKP